MKAILGEIGLTESEQKVYLALLDIGDATRGAIVTKSGIAGSKVYENLEKLHNKGLISTYTENNVRHFKPTNPKQLLSYLEERKHKLQIIEDEAKKILPKLATLFGRHARDEEVELYTGLRGFEIVFREQLELLHHGDTNYVIGGTQSIGEDAVVAFFRRIHIEREAKGIRTRMLFNVQQRAIVEQFYSSKEFTGTRNKFIEHSGPVAINIHADITLITVYGKKLTAMKITSQSVADSFKEYFEMLWSSAHD